MVVLPPSDTLGYRPTYLHANNVSAMLSVAPAYSLSAWVKPTANRRGSPLSFHDGTGKNVAAVSWSRDGEEKFSYYDEANGYQTADVPIYGNQNQGWGWHHVALVVDAARAEGALYIDGIPEICFRTRTKPTLDGLFSVGQEWDDGLTSSDYFTGLIDDVMVYKRALSHREVNDLHTTTYRRFSPTAEAVLEGDPPDFSHRYNRLVEKCEMDWLRLPAPY